MDQAEVPPPARSGGVQSVERAVDVLRALATVPRGGSALEIATLTGLDRTTVHRLLRTLAATGMAEADGSVYRLGAGCTVLGAGRLDSLGLREAALPFAVDLQRTVVRDRPAVVSISACALDEAVIVDRIWTPAVPLNIIVGIGWRFPIDQPVSGRSMLSTMADADIAACIGAERLARLADRLAAVRAREGMEFGSDEQHAGVGTIACPVLGPSGVAVGALVVAGLGMADDLRVDSALAQHLMRSAQSATRMLQGGR